MGQDLMRLQFSKIKEEFNFRQIQDDGSLNFSIDIDKYSHQNSITAEKQYDLRNQGALNNGEAQLSREKREFENQQIKNNEMNSLQSSGQFLFQNSSKTSDIRSMFNFDKDKQVQCNTSNKSIIQDSMVLNEHSPIKTLKKMQSQRDISDCSQTLNIEDKFQIVQGELIDPKNNTVKDLFQTKQTISVQNTKKFQFNLQTMVIAKKFISNLKKRVSSIVFKQLTRKQFNIIGDFASYFDYYVYTQRMIQSEKRTNTKKTIYIIKNSKFGNTFSQFVEGKYLFSQSIYENGEIIRNRKKICQKYFWDLMKDLFVAVIFIHSRKQIQEEGFSKYLDYIVFIKYLDTPQKLEEITSRLQISQTAQNWLKLVKLEFIVLLLVHIACCIFLRIGLSEMENQSQSWITKFQDQSFSTFELYLLSLYYIIITMTTIGYGDITPVTQYERMFIALVALIATNICAYSFSQINEIVKYEKSKNENFNNMMHGLNHSMNKLELDMSLQHKVRKYFEFQYKQDIEGAQGQEQLLEQLPSSLKNEVLLQTNNEAIQSISLFSNFSSDCQKEISLNIKQKYFKPDELIFNENEVNDKLFYVISGNVQTTLGISLKIENTANQNEMQLQILKKKDVFGYEGFILGQKNPYTAKSYKGAMISYIERDRLIQILQSFPYDKEFYYMFKDNQIFKTFSYKDISKQDVKFNNIKLNQIQISNCIACGSSSHTLKRCHIVQLSLRYKKDKKVYFQQRDKSIKRRGLDFFKSLQNNKQIQEQIINFKMVSDQNSIMSDVYSVLYSEEDSTSKQSKTNEEEDFSQQDDQQGNRKQQHKKSTYLNPKMANELVDVYRRRSQKDMSLNLVSINSPKSVYANSDLQAIDEGEAESERDTLKSQKAVNEEKIKINQFQEDGQNSKNESMQNSIEKIDSFLNNNGIPKLNLDKPISIEINLDIASKKSSKIPSIKSKKNTHTTIHQNSSRKLTGPSPSQNQINQKTISTICNEHSGKSNQLIANNMNTSINVEMYQNEEIVQKKRVQQKKQTKDSTQDDHINNNSYIASDDDNSQNINSSFDSNNNNPNKQLSLQQRIIQKRRQKYEKTYYEEENKIRTIMQQSHMTQLEANLFNILLPSSQGKINIDDAMDLPSPTQLLQRRHKYNNQVQFDIQQNESSASPSQIIDSKRRKSSKKITQNSTYRSENQEQKLSIIGLGKSNSILYRQHSLASKANQHDGVKDEISSPVSVSRSNKKLNAQTMVMLNSTPSVNRESSDYKIRFEQGIQNIDLLVIRKYMMIEQIKGNIKDFILVPDNEIEIDKIHRYKIYFPKGNYNYIIKKFRTKFDCLTKTKFMTSQVQKAGQRVSKILKFLNGQQTGSNQIKLQNTRGANGFGYSASSRNSFNEKDK
ncbi:cyclic nucleotide-binding domain protein (macronuclear) [Tetrahymena thermophila SB210]|uniref:Cyclic nucleotide-binding domain protein n=1 Tax=Tetrahymena thermophila (strain SB210) TaxID=312017 RepID=Q22U26_TETTS|nr:cyclic nucleotide-binding domain protein [Tetrahymena thermophila SB210]EAR88861.2 cyclic nucleotide-binding domain protein [Tetrahymena thermophila SB210]|eukprot:XP_001009106.2 cyclic nucleotide-binding domain protein [Tetrahymena thermophila SB210]